MDQVLHVSACGKVSPGLGTVVEGHATGLYGLCSGDVKFLGTLSLEKFVPPTSGVVGFIGAASLGYLDQHPTIR